MPDLTLVLVLALTATGNAIELAWTAPTHNADGTAIVEPLTYNVYRSHDGGAYKLTPHAGIKVTKASITGNIVSGALECFKVTALEAGIESAPTLPTCITVP